MYLLLGLSSILAVLFGGYLTLGITRHISDWSQRRMGRYDFCSWRGL